jgi:phosphoribosylglycinamide formyltransferase-1
VDRRVIPVKGRDPGEIAEETLQALLESKVDVIFLAGYLRLVPAPVVQRFQGRILNIHPALLPSFGGKGMWGRHVHQAVLDAGSRVTGPTVHVVDEVYDRGLILAQWPVPVRNDDTPETLAARVLAVEHRLYPEVAAHLCRSLQEGRPLRPLEPSGGSFVLE